MCGLMKTNYGWILLMFPNLTSQQLFFNYFQQKYRFANIYELIRLLLITMLFLGNISVSIFIKFNSIALISYILSKMSLQKEVEIYTYTLTILNLTLKVKFPCRIYLENQGKSITNEVQPTSNNKFIFNQEVTLKNETEKEFIELVVQLITEKGAKYVGGVVKLVQNELIGSEGQCVAVPISKCLDSEAFCEVRVDQVATSRVIKRGSPKRKHPLRSEYNPDVMYSSLKPKMNQQGETRSEYNFPISMNRIKDRRDKSKDPMVIINSVKKGLRGNESVYIERDAAISHVGGGQALSALQFEVYKEGYNKLKDKYRKQAEASRSEMNKRVALQTSQNNLKLESMRYKLKSEQLEKTLIEKSLKIKQLSDTISLLQKKQLDSKYLKEQVENKNYTVKSLEETIKALNRDNNELKTLQNQRYQIEQQNLQALKDEIEKLKKDFQNKEADFIRESKSKNQLIAKRQYDLHNKSQQLERAKCNIDDLDKNLSNKTFEWEKILQNERSSAKSRQQELKEKITVIQGEKIKQNEKLNQLEQALQEKKGEISKLQYDRKVMTQNTQILVKENQQLKVIKQKHIELNREHKIVIDEKVQIERARDRQSRNKDIEIEQLNERLKILGENNKKTIKDLEEKLKLNQFKLIESDSQNQSFKNQLEKLKRQYETSNKELLQTKNQLKQSKNDAKIKDEKILLLTNELTNINNRSNQGEYSTKIEVTRLKEQTEKLFKSWEEERSKVKEFAETISSLELAANKNKMEWQFREEKALKELGYSRQKVKTLEAFKTDLESQISSLTQTITNLKVNEKSTIEKIQKLELQAIKSKEIGQKYKKDIKILEQKIQNCDINLKNKVKEITDFQLTKEKLQKRINEQESEAANLKNELNKETSEKQRYQKIGDLLQNDITRSKQEQNSLNTIIANKQTAQLSLREQLKKEKQEFTKIDMKLNAHKKQFEKFKETIVDNLNTVFTAIPEGLNVQNKQYRSIVSDKSTLKENSEVLNLLISLGRQARGNAVRNIEQLKQSIRDNEKLNSDYSLTVNKRNTTEFQYNQNITALQEEMSELIEEKTREQNRYEEEIFLLEGRVKEKQVAINELTQQVQELDFMIRNTKTESDIFREEAQKKQFARLKTIEELRDQLDYHHAEIDNLEKSMENYRQTLESAELELENSKETITKLTKDLSDAKDSIQQYQQLTNNLKKQLKKSNDKGEQWSMNLTHKTEELRKCEDSLQQQERKAAELREFLKGLMKQKQQIIKNELQKSEKVLELETTIEEMRHQIESLDDHWKKSKIIEEQQRENIKKLTKSLKDQQTAKLQEKAKGNKLNDRLKDKEKEVNTKDEIISKLQDKIKKQGEKRARDIRELEAELDETHQKLLNAQRLASEQILLLENQNEKITLENEKISQAIGNAEQGLFRQRNRSEQLKQKLQISEKQLIQSQQSIKDLTLKLQGLNEEIRLSEEESYKLQGRINLLEMKFEMKQNDHDDKLQNLNEDWSSKYYSMEEQYEQRLELIEKERDFLKEKLAEGDREIKKLIGDLKMQESNANSLKKNFEEKVKLLEEDRLSAIAQKNTENQRLVDEVRITFDNLKQKESECRKLTNDYELARANISKLELKWKESDEKIRNLNRTFQSESQQFKKKEQSYKKMRELVTSSIWKSERQVRRLVQNSARQIMDLTDEKSTIKVMEISRSLQQSILTAISIKLQERQI